MTQFEIYWNDLTDDAKERLSELYNDNVHLTPLTVIEVDNVQGDKEKNEDIEYIKSIILQWGEFTITERHESSPVINSIGEGDICELIEGIRQAGVDTIVYNNGNEVDWDFYLYKDLDADIISEIREIVETYENDMEDTMEKCSGYES